MRPTQLVNNYTEKDLMKAIRDRRGGDPEIQDASIEAMLPEVTGKAEGFRFPVFRWEIGNTPKKTVIRIFPDTRLLEKLNILDDMSRLLQVSIDRYLGHLGFAGTWITSMPSFCITFDKSLDSIELAKIVLADFEYACRQNLH